MKNSILELIGNTPLIRLRGFEKKYGLQSKIYVKAECFNPFGSLKDRAALRIIEDAEADGRISCGCEIVEATSGNMGIALAAIARVKGYGAKIAMPADASEGRKRLISAYGAELLLTDPALGMREAEAVARSLASESENRFYTRQFENPSGVSAHREGTAPEIERQTGGDVDAVICGIGSGATCTGLGEYFRGSKTKIIGVEPAGTDVPRSGKIQKIEGIGAGFVPAIFKPELMYKTVRVDYDGAAHMKKAVAESDGLYVGLSSGAVLYAARELAREGDFAGKRIVLIIADGMGR